MHSKIEDFNIQDLIINLLIVNIQDLTHNLHWFVYFYIITKFLNGDFCSHVGLIFLVYTHCIIYTLHNVNQFHICPPTLSRIISFDCWRQLLVHVINNLNSTSNFFINFKLLMLANHEVCFQIFFAIYGKNIGFVGEIF